MTSVNITNYGSIYISEDSEVNPRRQEKERSRHISRTEDREETYQELLPQEESWTSRHKQFIGLFQKFTRVHSMLEMFRSWPRICCWRIVHRQQLCDKSDGRECAGPAPGQNPDADADLLLNMLLQVISTYPNTSMTLHSPDLCPRYPGPLGCGCSSCCR